MQQQPNSSSDDRLTIIALGALAYMAQSVLHEGFGHGLTAWLSGADSITVSTVAMSAVLETRWIAASGTLVNLLVAAVLWLVLRGAERFSATTRYFLVLLFAGNLFTGTGYFFFSGVTGFGDWEQVIRGLHPYWLFRLALVVLGVGSYFSSVLLVARELRSFASSHVRITRLTWTPYFTEGALAAVAGLLNPAGAIYVLLSALPATLGANSGLLWIRYYMPTPREGEQLQAIPRSYSWIAAAAVCGIIFIFIIGRGLTWHH